MMKIRGWERFQFHIDYRQRQASFTTFMISFIYVVKDH